MLTLNTTGTPAGEYTLSGNQIINGLTVDFSTLTSAEELEYLTKLKGQMSVISFITAPGATDIVTLNIGGTVLSIATLNGTALTGNSVAASGQTYSFYFKDTGVDAQIFVNDANASGDDIFGPTAGLVNFATGDLAAGYELNNKLVKDVLIDMLVGYPRPAFTTFSRLPAMTPTTIEVGESIVINGTYE